MLVKLEAGTYDIEWRHEDCMNESGHATKMTTCKISYVRPGVIGKERFEPVTSGRVVLHANDQFNKAKGRKASLAKALKAFLGHDRKKKAIVWATYLSTCKDIRHNHD